MSARARLPAACGLSACIPGTAFACHELLLRPVSPRRASQPPAGYRAAHKQVEATRKTGGLHESYVRRRPTLPHTPVCSTIGAERLNFRVRNGAGCFPFAMAAETLLSCVMTRTRRPSTGPASVPDRNSGTTQWTRNIFEGQALGLLVPVGWALLLYTSGLSTQSSTGGLTRLTRWETSS